MDKLLVFFRPRPAFVLAELELANAKRELLQAESAREYATRIVEYQKDRIRRLSACIASGELQ